MCKLCERDKGKPTNSLCMGVFPDRLAVLEKDHRAMERLRSGNIFFRCNIVSETWMAETVETPVKYTNDPADAILAVKE